MRYTIQSALLAVFVVLTFNVVSSLSTPQPAAPATSLSITKEPDSAYTITNLKGQYLFKEKCSSCHSLFARADPDLLQGFEERIPDKRLLYEWIQNSSKVLKSGNPYFNAEYKEYGVLMPAFSDLTDSQISDILNYIWQVQHLKRSKTA